MQQNIILNTLRQHIESIIFTSSSPISRDEILNCINSFFGTNFDIDVIQALIDEIKVVFDAPEFSFKLIGIDNGYQFYTKAQHNDLLNYFLKQQHRKKLSMASLETLAIIAYKQPISKVDIEAIRGVNCDYAVQKLLEKELVSISGRAETVGKPLLYKTSEKFMSYFGLKNIQDLPKPKELELTENSIGLEEPLNS